MIRLSSTEYSQCENGHKMGATGATFMVSAEGSAFNILSKKEKNVLFLLLKSIVTFVLQSICQPGEELN